VARDFVGSTDGFKELVARDLPDATPDQIQQAIRSETRLMPVAERIRELAECHLMLWAFSPIATLLTVRRPHDEAAGRHILRFRDLF